MNYLLLSGTVKELNITKGFDDLSFPSQGKKFAGLASIAAAATGNITSSTILANSSNGADVSMEFFTCRVDKLILSGRFYKVDFKDGDNIEFVVVKKDEVNEVYCARNPTQRLVWCIPYRMRGHIAQKKHDIFSSLTISAFSSLAFALFSYYQESRPLADCWRTVLGFSFLSFFIILIVNFLSRWPFYKFSYEATSIFKTLCFKDPSMVDLPKNHDSAEKEFYEQIGEHRPWQVEPWKYRYKANSC